MKKKKKLRKPSSGSLFPSWELEMNSAQLEAIRHDEGPLRVLAPAGSGKTRVTTHRIVRLVEERGVDPSRILAVTFSKKAAKEMEDRTKKLGIDGARIGTWHSVCLSILKEDQTEESEWDIDKHGTRAKSFLRDVVGYKGMDWKRVDIGKLTRFISICKANLFAPESPEAKEYAERIYGWQAAKATEAFAHFNEKVEANGVLTFDDMLVFVAKHLEDEDNRRTWAEKYDHVIHDESQDENLAQKHISHLLAKDHRNYMVVGDVFQAIYSFRGSKPDYLAQFDRDWPDAKTVWLGINYRSGSKIIEAANNIIRSAQVPGYAPKDMIPGRRAEGDVRAIAATDFDDEANNFVGWIRERTRTGEATYGDFTALFRTNAQSRALEEGLLSAEIPYLVVGGTNFYERKEVRDLLAYLRLADERGDVEDVRRCINAPYRFLGAEFVERIMDTAGDNKGADWGDIVAEAARGKGIWQKQKDSVREWTQIINHTRSSIRDALQARKEARKKGIRIDVPPDEEIVRGTPAARVYNGRPAVILDDIIRATRYIDHVTKEEGEESIENSGAANVRELVRVAGRFSTVTKFLNYIDETIRSADRQAREKAGERVLLMSIHRSKGLEWPNVWLSGFNELVIPHKRAEDFEEERRLAYVAATRARDRLVFSYVRSMATRAGVSATPASRFLVDSRVPLDTPDDDPFPEPRIKDLLVNLDEIPVRRRRAPSLNL